MIKRIFLLASVAFTYAGIVLGQESFPNIVPAETAFEQVRETFGVQAKIIRQDKVFFPLREGNLFLGVSPGECVESTWGRWNLAKGIIVDVVYYPRKRRKPSYFNLPTPGMVEGVDSGHKTFKNDIIGLYYATQFGKVTRIHYYPASRHHELRCKD